VRSKEVYARQQLVKFLIELRGQNIECEYDQKNQKQDILEVFILVLIFQNVIPLPGVNLCTPFQT
jgi:hypothetical protein